MSRFTNHLKRPVPGVRQIFHKQIRFIHVHLLLVLVIAVVAIIAAFVSGFFAGRQSLQYDGAYFRARFALIQPHPSGPPLGYRVPAATVATVQQTRIFIPASQMPPVSDQGQIGQCECYAFREQLEHLILKRTGQAVAYSCRFWYTLIDRGQDTGSRIEDYVQTLASVGGLKAGEGFDYSGVPQPSELNLTQAQTFIPKAAAHRYALHELSISPYFGGGQNALNACDSELVHDRTCNLGIAVYYNGDPSCLGFEDVNANSGLIDEPPGWPNHISCSLIGYHAVTIRGTDKTMCELPDRGDGVCGWYLIQNHWTRHWGINCVTHQPDTQNGGCAWISRRFVADAGFSVVSLRLQQTVTPQAPKPKPFLQPGPYLDHQLPPPPGTDKLRVPRLGTGPLWVAGVCAKDVAGPDPLHLCGGNLDMAPFINNEAHRVGISPVGFTATLGGECGFYTHSTQCDRLGGGADYSFGACQVTIGTAAQFGLGSGYFDGYYGGNTSLIRNYENVASQCIHLGTTVMGNYAAIERTNCPPASDYPNLDVAWNAGPYNSCAFLMNPSGQAGSNFYLNFQGWMKYAYQFARSGADPYARPPRPFNVTLWCSYARAHHRPCPAYRAKGHRTWAASIFYAHARLGGKIPHDVWVPPNRRAHRRFGFLVYRFAHGSVYATPSRHHVRIVYR
jgi:hypothetical protein